MYLQMNSIHFLSFLLLLLIALEASFLTALRSHKSNSSQHRRRGIVESFAPDGLDAAIYHSTLRTSCKTPSYTKVITLTKPITVAAGQTFDCKLVKYQRADRSCNLNVERGGDQAVFLLEEGAILKNCILGYSQESVYCLGTCRVENCHWLEICDEAIAFYMPSGQATVTGCSFSNAGNKALQFNGGGKVVVNDTCFSNVDIAYRSCGKRCSTSKRSVVFNNIVINGVNTLAGYNHRDGDTANIVSYSGKAKYFMCEVKDANTPKGQMPPG
ncbi:pectate lyase-domain-containing protein [Melampsora americana]|nr:pectate lyase-domain-containing protein [Melampsora americana]